MSRRFFVFEMVLEEKSLHKLLEGWHTVSASAPEAIKARNQRQREVNAGDTTHAREFAKRSEICHLRYFDEASEQNGRGAKTSEARRKS